MFGMVDTSVSPALGYMEIVPNRTQATLLPIIQGHVHPGTVIWSDEWASYQNVGSLPNVSSHYACCVLLHRTCIPAAP